jgi:hypothetical protein
VCNTCGTDVDQGSTVPTKPSQAETINFAVSDLLLAI